MEKIKNHKSLDIVSKIYEKSEDCKLKPSIFKELKPEIEFIAQKFQITDTQAFFLSVIFGLNVNVVYNVDMPGIAKHLGVNTIEVLKYNNDIEILFDKNIILKETTLNENFETIFSYTFTISNNATDSIVNNTKFKESNTKFNNLIDVIEKITEISELYIDSKITITLMRKKIENLINQHKHFEVLKMLDLLKLDFNCKMTYLFLIWKTLTGRKFVDVETTIGEFIKISGMKIWFIQRFNDKENNILVNHDLIELEENDFINDTNMKLTPKSLNILEKEGIKLFNKVEKQEKDVIYNNKIAKIQMYYNQSEKQQIDMFAEALKSAKFKQLQKRLSAKNLPAGVTAIFYGFPGTGKTETVLQIARQTKRNIMKVDISQTKSKWFGDTEKIIKDIFRKYYDLKSKSKSTPILLFNEADAIISKRKDIESSSVAQTENTVQNIILEELENFDGIFIATTNLVKNIDSAFERRFLFKVEFEKPNENVKAKIWKSKLPALSKSECLKLAQNYNLSGGQINNIVRKVEMYEVLNNKKAGFEIINRFCTEENFDKTNRQKIGF